MKKSLLLAALLLSSAAQAETYVCTVASQNTATIYKIVRNEIGFSVTNSSTLYEGGMPRVIYEASLTPIIETETMLNLIDIDTEGTKLGIYMINKKTNILILDAVLYSVDTLRSEGHCVKI